MLNMALRMLCEKPTSGWVAWGKKVSLFLAPDETKSTFQPWAESCLDNIAVYREVAKDPAFWQKLSKHYASENHAEVITQDHVSCIKSICMSPRATCGAQRSHMPRQSN
jgi:proteasome activator subunit 4